MYKTAQLIVVLIQTEAAASDSQRMLREDYAPLAAYEVYLRNSDGVTLPACIGSLELACTVGNAYNGSTLNVYHKLSAGALETCAGTVDAGKLPVTTDALSPFLIEVTTASVNAITVISGSSGDVAPAGTVYVSKGRDKAFVFTPSHGLCAGYGHGGREHGAVVGNSYTLENVQMSHALHATFKKPYLLPDGDDDPTTYTVTIPATANGHISPTGKVSLEYGDSLMIYFYLNEGYEVDQVLINGKEVDGSAGSCIVETFRTIWNQRHL